MSDQYRAMVDQLLVHFVNNPHELEDMLVQQERYLRAQWAGDKRQRRLVALRYPRDVMRIAGTLEEWLEFAKPVIRETIRDYVYWMAVARAPESPGLHDFQAGDTVGALCCTCGATSDRPQHRKDLWDKLQCLSRPEEVVLCP